MKYTPGRLLIWCCPKEDALPSVQQAKIHTRGEILILLQICTSVGAR